MSATPRPWEVDKSWEDGPWALKEAGKPKLEMDLEGDVDGAIGQRIGPDDAVLIVRAVNAFAALLAVAKAAARLTSDREDYLATIGDASMALDRAHPGWHEWPDVN